mmetsp:Transcript_34734/g.71386  ORF Transcript_34734/g.71386 Transcript_34734/m.71386 type:complete len:167 (-) Transcript_34734:18-518(-)
MTARRRVDEEEGAAYSRMSEDACPLLTACCRSLGASLRSEEGRRGLLLGIAAFAVAAVLLRGPLLDLLEALLKVLEYFAKPLLFIMDFVPPPVLEAVSILTVGGSLMYLCYRYPDVTCPVLLVLLVLATYCVLSFTVWYNPIDSAKESPDLLWASAANISEIIRAP